MDYKSFNEEFKKAAVEKLYGQNSLGLSGVALELGISKSTLFCWKAKYANGFSMKKAKKERPTSDWTAEEKMETLIEAASLSENELGEYLRSNGLNSCDLETFKNDFITSIPDRGRPKLDPEVVKLRKDNTNLTKDLNKKNRALAEMSARVVLLKKSHLIWGEPEDDE